MFVLLFCVPVEELSWLYRGMLRVGVSIRLYETIKLPCRWPEGREISREIGFVGGGDRRLVRGKRVVPMGMSRSMVTL